MLNPNVGPMLPLAVQDETRALTFRFFLHYAPSAALAPFLGAVSVVHGDDPGDSAPPAVPAGAEGEEGDTDSVASVDSLAVFESLPNTLLDAFADEVSAHVLDIRAEAPAVHYVRALQCMRSMRLSPRASNRIQSAIHALTAPGGALAASPPRPALSGGSAARPPHLPAAPPGAAQARISRRAASVAPRARPTTSYFPCVQRAAAVPRGRGSDAWGSLTPAACVHTDGPAVPACHPPRLPPSAPVLLARVGVALGPVARHRVVRVGRAGAAAAAPARPRAAARRGRAGRVGVRGRRGRSLAAALQRVRPAAAATRARRSAAPRRSPRWRRSRPTL